MVISACLRGRVMGKVFSPVHSSRLFSPSILQPACLILQQRNKLLENCFSWQEEDHHKTDEIIEPYEGRWSACKSQWVTDQPWDEEGTLAPFWGTTCYQSDYQSGHTGNLADTLQRGIARGISGLDSSTLLIWNARVSTGIILQTRKWRPQGGGHWSNPSPSFTERW
jgi:hypothetical protein